MLWWISFANAEGNLGVAISEGNDVEEAVKRIKKNPGGQVMGIPIPEQLDKETKQQLSYMRMFKVYQHSDLPGMFVKTGDIKEEDSKALENIIEVICEDHNNPQE